MSGSLATASMRKPSGNLNAVALCSGDIGLGASVGLISGFAVLFVIAHTGRKRWLEQG